MANRTRPSRTYVTACKNDFKNRLEGAIRVYCSTERDANVLIRDQALQTFVDSFANFTYNQRESTYTVSAFATSEITVTRLGQFAKGAAAGGAGGAALGMLGGGGAGAGIGALIGIIGGPIGVGIGAGIGAGVGMAIGGAAGAIPGGGFGGWIITKFGHDIQVTWHNICRYLTDQNDGNAFRPSVAFVLDAIGRQ